ncbi:MAG: hypothetical protein EAZ51_07875, partial [Sphingobacteriales bacterium]
MKKILFFTIIFASAFSAFSVNYYSKSTGNLNLTSTWGENTNGTGTAPSNFTTGNDIFYIRNRTTATIAAAWTVSGANSKVVLGDATVAAITFTIPSGFAFTGTIDVTAASAGSNTLVIANATVPTLGTISTGSTVNFASSGTQTVPAKTYGTLILSNAGDKDFAYSAPSISTLLSIQGDAGAINSLATTYASGAFIEFRNFTTNPRNRADNNVGWVWRLDQYGGGTAASKIRVADGATINITDIIPVQTSALPTPNGTWSTPQAKMFVPLEIIGTGRVNISNGCRIDIFTNLITATGGQLEGVAGSRIHISGQNTSQSLGKINTSGFLCLDKDAGVATLTDNVNAGHIYIWNPNDGNLGEGGIFSCDLAASITAGGLTMGQSAPGTPLPASAFPAPTTLPNTNGTLRLNNANLGAGISHSHTITGNVTMLDGILDFTSGTLTDPRSSILNVGGNFIKTGTSTTINTSVSGSHAGQINFNGTGSPVQNIAINTSTEVSFAVKPTASVLLTGNVVSSTSTESFVVET